MAFDFRGYTLVPVSMGRYMGSNGTTPEKSSDLLIFDSGPMSETVRGPMRAATGASYGERYAGASPPPEAKRGPSAMGIRFESPRFEQLERMKSESEAASQRTRQIEGEYQEIKALVLKERQEAIEKDYGRIKALALRERQERLEEIARQHEEVRAHALREHQERLRARQEQEKRDKIALEVGSFLRRVPQMRAQAQLEQATREEELSAWEARQAELAVAAAGAIAAQRRAELEAASPGTVFAHPITKVRSLD